MKKLFNILVFFIAIFLSACSGVSDDAVSESLTDVSFTIHIRDLSDNAKTRSLYSKDEIKSIKAVLIPSSGAQQSDIKNVDSVTGTVSFSFSQVSPGAITVKVECYDQTSGSGTKIALGSGSGIVEIGKTATVSITMRMLNSDGTAPVLNTIAVVSGPAADGKYIYKTISGHEPDISKLYDNYREMTESEAANVNIEYISAEECYKVNLVNSGSGKLYDYWVVLPVNGVPLIDDTPCLAPDTNYKIKLFMKTNTGSLLRLMATLTNKKYPEFNSKTFMLTTSWRTEDSSDNLYVDYDSTIMPKNFTDPYFRIFIGEFYGEREFYIKPVKVYESSAVDPTQNAFTIPVFLVPEGGKMNVDAPPSVTLSSGLPVINIQSVTGSSATEPGFNVGPFNVKTDGSCFYKVDFELSSTSAAMMYDMAFEGVKGMLSAGAYNETYAGDFIMKELSGNCTGSFIFSPYESNGGLVDDLNFHNYIDISTNGQVTVKKWKVTPYQAATSLYASNNTAIENNQAEAAFFWAGSDTSWKPVPFEKTDDEDYGTVYTIIVNKGDVSSVTGRIGCASIDKFLELNASTDPAADFGDGIVSSSKLLQVGYWFSKKQMIYPTGVSNFYFNDQNLCFTSNKLKITIIPLNWIVEVTPVD